MIELFANVDFALTAWLCYVFLGFMFTPGCDCCNEPSVSCEGCASDWTSMPGESIDDSGVTGGCGWTETAGSWWIDGDPNGRLVTDSDNATALATFAPGAGGFYLALIFFAGAGSGSGTPGDIVRIYVDYPDTYVEIRCSNGVDIEGYVKIIAGGSTVFDSGDLPISGGVVFHNVNLCVTPSSIRIEAGLGGVGTYCAIASELTLTDFDWGVGTGAITNAGGGSFAVVFDSIFVQENGVDGDGNPCGCERWCYSDCPVEFRVDMTGWANGACSECVDLNTSFWVQESCTNMPQTCDHEASNYVDCIYNSEVDPCNDDDTITAIELSPTELSLIGWVMFIGHFAHQTWEFKNEDFNIETDCATATELSMTNLGKCDDLSFDWCDGSSVMMEVTAE